MKYAKWTLVVTAGSAILLGAMGQAFADEGAPSDMPKMMSQKMMEMKKWPGKTDIVAKLKAEGLDTSSITEAMVSDTNEAAFWDAVKAIRMQKEVKMRMEKIEKMKTEGFDTSSITEAMINNPNGKEFWDALKVLLDAKGYDERMKHLKKMEEKGMDTSGFTEDVVKDGQKFYDMAKGMQMDRQTKQMEMQKERIEGNMEKYKGNMQNNAMNREYVNKKLEMNPNMPQEQREKLTKKLGEMEQQGEKIEDRMNKAQGNLEKVGEKMKNQATKPALTKMAREKLVKKFEAVAEDKKATTLEALTKKITAQIEAAQAKKLKLTVKRLQETLALAQEILGTQEEEMSEDQLIDTITQ